MSFVGEKIDSRGRGGKYLEKEKEDHLQTAGPSG